MLRLFKITVLVSLVQMFCTPFALAVTKLSTPIETAEAYATTAKDYLERGAAMVNEVQTKYNELKMLADQGELAAYIKKEMVEYGKDYIKEEGGKYIEQYQQQFLAEQRKLLDKAKVDLASAQAAREDYERAVKDAQQEKNEQIDERLTMLRAQIQAQNLSEDERKKIADEIADLEKQRELNLNKPIENDETYQGMKEKEQKLSEDIGKASAQTEELENQANLQELSVDLFKGNPSNEENQSIYQTEIEALFLKENEESTSENLARIKKNRNLEYYNAIQNAMNVALVNGARSTETAEQTDNNLNAGANVEGNLALKNVNISAVIEKAKAASHLTEALLAEMRLKTTKDMVSWNNKNRLYDYKKPITEFDIDYYELKKTDLKTDILNSLYEQGKSATQDLYNQNIGKVQNLWHKL